MYGSFSDDSLDNYQEILNYLNNPSLEFSEESLYDFTRCLRPNGSAYGTRGTCQAPNKVAPKQDIPEMGKKDFLAGGGVAAVGKGLSSMQVVNRGRDARARAFKAGGGMASMGKGMTRDEVVAQGAKNRADAYKAGGGTKSSKSANSAIEQGAKNRAAAYKAGGGDTAARMGMSKSSIIEQGAKNLKAAYEAGGGSAAQAKSRDTKEVIEKGKKALEGATKAGGGSVKKGQDILADPMGYTNRSKLEAGGGEAMVNRVKQALSKSLKRQLTEQEVKDVEAKVKGLGVENLNRYYKAGGGDKAISGGKTVDEVIDQGQKIIEQARERAKVESAQKVRAKLDKGSQFV